MEEDSEEEEEERSEVLMVGLVLVLGVLLAEVLFFFALSEDEADFDLVRTPFSPFIVCESKSVILEGGDRRIVVGDVGVVKMTTEIQGVTARIKKAGES